jgi:hypothetical protein
MHNDFHHEHNVSHSYHIRCAGTEICVHWAEGSFEYIWWCKVTMQQLIKPRAIL